MSNQVPANLLSIVMDVKNRIEAIYREERKKLEDTTFIGATSQERVTVTYKGREFIECTIKDDTHRSLIPDLVVIACNKPMDAYRKGADVLQRETEAAAMAVEQQANEQIASLYPKEGVEGEGGKVIPLSPDKNKN